MNVVERGLFLNPPFGLHLKLLGQLINILLLDDTFFGDIFAIHLNFLHFSPISWKFFPIGQIWSFGQNPTLDFVF